MIQLDRHHRLRILIRFITHQTGLMCRLVLPFLIGNLYFLILSLTNLSTKSDYEQHIQT